MTFVLASGNCHLPPPLILWPSAACLLEIIPTLTFKHLVSLKKKDLRIGKGEKSLTLTLLPVTE